MARRNSSSTSAAISGSATTYDTGRRVRTEGIGWETGLQQLDERRLLGIGVHRRTPTDAVVGCHVDQAEVGEERDTQLSESLVTLGIVERPREQRARLRQEPLVLLGPADASRSRAPPRERRRDIEHDAGLARDVPDHLHVDDRETIGLLVGEQHAADQRARP